jgi:hypothetical protein
MRFDAHKQPDPQAWLELDESERIDLGIDDGLGSIFSVAALTLFSAIHVCFAPENGHCRSLLPSSA